MRRRQFTPLAAMLRATGLVIAALALAVTSYIGAERLLPGVVRLSVWENGVSLVLVATGVTAFAWCYRSVPRRAWGLLVGIVLALICFWFAVMFQLHFTCEPYPTYIGERVADDRCVEGTG